MRAARSVSGGGRGGGGSGRGRTAGRARRERKYVLVRPKLLVGKLLAGHCCAALCVCVLRARVLPAPRKPPYPLNKFFFKVCARNAWAHPPPLSPHNEQPLPRDGARAPRERARAPRRCAAHRARRRRAHGCCRAFRVRRACRVPRAACRVPACDASLTRRCVAARSRTTPFAFDRVFDAYTNQHEVYAAAVDFWKCWRASLREVEAAPRS